MSCFFYHASLNNVSVIFILVRYYNYFFYFNYIWTRKKIQYHEYLEMNQFRKYIVSFTNDTWSDKIKLENNLREYVEHINASSITSIEMFVFKYKYIQSRWKDWKNQSYKSDNHGDDHKNTSSKNTFSLLSCYHQIWSASDERNSIMRATSRPPYHPPRQFSLRSIKPTTPALPWIIKHRFWRLSRLPQESSRLMDSCIK